MYVIISSAPLSDTEMHKSFSTTHALSDRYNRVLVPNHYQSSLPAASLSQSEYAWVPSGGLMPPKKHINFNIISSSAPKSSIIIDRIIICLEQKQRRPTPGSDGQKVAQSIHTFSSIFACHNTKFTSPALNQYNTPSFWADHFPCMRRQCIQSTASTPPPPPPLVSGFTV